MAPPPPRIRENIVNELHKPARRNYQRRRVKIFGLTDLLQSDLVEMIPLARYNRGMKYILTAINCASKYAYAVPLKSKKGTEVASALDKILRNNKFKYLQTDLGKEYYNATLKRLLDKYGIHHYSSFSEKKQA